MACDCNKIGCSDCNIGTYDIQCRMQWCNDACPNDKINQEPNKCTLCDKCKDNNMFYVKKAPGFGGRCILDEMTFAQLQNILASNPCAKRDLYAITSDPCALQIAAQTDLKRPPCVQNMELQRRLSSNIPMYTFFKGSGMGKDVK